MSERPGPEHPTHFQPTLEVEEPHAELLEQLAHSPVAAEISPLLGNRLLDISISGARLPDGSSPVSFEAMLMDQADGTIRADAAMLSVAENLRGHGLGERLFRGLAYAAKEAGASVLDSELHSPTSAHIIAKIFGDKLLEFYETRHSGPLGDTEVVAMPLSAEQAVQSLTRAGSDGDMKDPKIGVRVDLQKVDMSGWERPLITVEH